MIDYLYVECSMASNGALARFRRRFPIIDEGVDRALDARPSSSPSSEMMEVGTNSWGCCFTRTRVGSASKVLLTQGEDPSSEQAPRPALFC